MEIHTERRNEKDSSKFSEVDKQILQSVFPIVEGVAHVFGGNCEVVLHSLEDFSNSVVQIANGHITGRTIGSPVTDYVAEALDLANASTHDVIGSYFTKTEEGRTLKSVKIVIRNAERKALGLLCINIDLTDSLLNFIENFKPDQNISKQNTQEHFPTNINELVHEMVATTLEKINIRKKTSSGIKNKLIVEELCRKGVFDMKGAIDIVAKEMDVSRYTIYNYLREVKAKITDEVTA